MKTARWTGKKQIILGVYICCELIEFFMEGTWATPLCLPVMQEFNTVADDSMIKLDLEI